MLIRLKKAEPGKKWVKGLVLPGCDDEEQEEEVELEAEGVGVGGVPVSGKNKGKERSKKEASDSVKLMSPHIFAMDE
jgi:hypothetical protein